VSVSLRAEELFIDDFSPEELPTEAVIALMCKTGKLPLLRLEGRDSIGIHLEVWKRGEGRRCVVKGMGEERRGVKTVPYRCASLNQNKVHHSAGQNNAAQIIAVEASQSLHHIISLHVPASSSTLDQRHPHCA
jgi:hypothetical protein